MPHTTPLPAFLASRRSLLRATLGFSAATLGAAVLRPGSALAAACSLTPAQTEGPYYPPEFGAPGNDLLAPGPDGALPRGEPIAIVGRVTDAACRPVAGAVVEIWQADGDGRYAHPSDRQSGEPDPRFRYWGRTVTDGDGTYRFRTLRPAAYRMFSAWRTPHVHFKVRPPGARVLTTQMYFAGHELNARDSLLKGLSEAQQAAVLTHPEPPDATAPDLPRHRFDIALA